MSELVGLRDAAAALGFSRKKLLRLIRDGLPVTREGERVQIDVEEARAWIETFEADGARTAPSLHPDDPRFLEKTYAAKIDALKLAIESGHLLYTDDVQRRVADEFAAVRAAALHVPTALTAAEFVGPDALALIVAAIEDALEPLKIDSPESWPVIGEMPSTPSVTEQPADADRAFAPRFAPSDPRHAFHDGKAKIARAKYEAMVDSLYPRADLLAWFGKRAEHVRDRLRAIPELLDFNASEESLRDRLADEIHTALQELSSVSV